MFLSLVNTWNYVMTPYTEFRNKYSEVRFIDITNYGYSEAILLVPSL
jgi:hypothetical protein